jgi:hypothetical protein
LGSDGKIWLFLGLIWVRYGFIWVRFGFVFSRSSIMTGKVWVRFSKKYFRGTGARIQESEARIWRHGWQRDGLEKTWIAPDTHILIYSSPASLPDWWQKKT